MKLEINLTQEQRVSIFRQLFKDFDSLISGQIEETVKEAKRYNPAKKTPRIKNGKGHAHYRARVSSHIGVETVGKFLEKMNVGETFQKISVRKLIDEDTGRKNWDTYIQKSLDHHMKAKRIKRVDKGVYERIS